ncbi:hypothetical protein POJ06DRAFT_82055 [Lipomyces tetrasporus]|uniref:Zn(2)-C6 fungal-type domain-containing protein n=1 Tax=Lipomyces tetrasporus TaxID=54092 RepID=A0AAD7QVM6_9ASCO|nr:uncharacterized protein POJ06DRAFT_82055 [Lipomyces tetrasporus]KAJ8102349.1 hypothetical protein POJ06DRAFT_82055 [Lipomyces tetrasporus]
MNPPAKRYKGVACVHCRQMKLRCDSGDRFPAPCSRCHKSGRDCSINPSYKRTARRDRLDELEREIHVLRSNLWESSTSVNRVNDPVDTPSVANEEQNARGAPSSTDTSPSPISDIQILEQTMVSRDLFINILDEYYRYYHPRFQFLPPKERVLQECGSCRLLFWAVVAVASRSVQGCTEFRKSLIWPIRRLAMESVIRETPSLSLVQAYLLLCVWPMPFGAVTDDPSWTYCGIATHKAQHLGLHRPDHLNEFVQGAAFDHELLVSMRNTWLACFIVNQNISARLGIPATIRPDHAVMQALNSDDFCNPTFRHLLELAHKEATFSELLGQNVATADGLTSDPLPVIQATDLEIEQFEMRHKSTWTTGVERSLLGTKLRLYSYAFLRSDSTVDCRTEDRAINRTRSLTTCSSRISFFSYLSKCYVAALRLIEISCPTEATNLTAPDEDLHLLGLSSASAAAASNSTLFWTSSDVSNIILATFVLLQFTRRWNLNVDDTEAENAISRAWNLLSSLSIAEGDHYNRICDIIEYIGKLKWPSSSKSEQHQQQPTLLMRSRMGASIGWDLIHSARRRFDSGGATYSKQLPEMQQSGVSLNSNISVDAMIGFPEMPGERSAAFDDILWPMWDSNSRPNHLS